MQITTNKKEQCMDMIKREEYEYTPKQGFVLTHFQTVAWEFLRKMSKIQLKKIAPISNQVRTF